jgi:hypothetical protein
MSHSDCANLWTMNCACHAMFKLKLIAECHASCVALYCTAVLHARHTQQRFTRAQGPVRGRSVNAVELLQAVLLLSATGAHLLRSLDSVTQVTSHPQPPSHVCNITHLQQAQLAPPLQVCHLTAQVLQQQVAGTQESPCLFEHISLSARRPGKCVCSGPATNR